MATTKAATKASATPTIIPLSKPEGLQARGYQLEMFEQSMQGNVIVLMDTGSGKTNVSILRMRAELDRRTDENQLIWFLTPKVALCEQQYEVIRAQLPSARTRLLLGRDNVDKWSNAAVWNAALDSVQIVVSTPQILLDALKHGFVRLARISLLVFDEAHHCARGDTYNRIMQDFYHADKRAGATTAAPVAPATGRLPHILGLTATPGIRPNKGEQELIEKNLDAVSVTPRVHLRELSEFVNRPALQRLVFPTPGSGLTTTYDTNGTPVAVTPVSPVPPVATSPGLVILRRLTGLSPNISTEAFDQLVKLNRKATHIYEELGPWAADYFITETFWALSESRDFIHGGQFTGKTELRETLAGILGIGGELSSLRNRLGDPANSSQLSHKVVCLINFLTAQDDTKCTCIIFVQQRAVVGVLRELLDRYPVTRARFLCAAFVGTAGSASKRYTLSELLDLRGQKQTLAEFRSRAKNLVIGTDVLEEGIDIPACNLVICFDLPPNMKSLVQRRGRARQPKSQFVVIYPDTDREILGKMQTWQDLEDQIAKKCREQSQVRDRQRERQRADDDVELVGATGYEEEEADEPVNDMLVVEATGAKLNAADAIPHLNHFCSLLPKTPFVANEPLYTFHPTREDTAAGLTRARVTLPGSVSGHVQVANSSRAWMTEKAARRDAALQAYAALYEAGFLTDNLLPLPAQDSLADPDGVGILPNPVPVSSRYTPWPSMAERWLVDPDPHSLTVTLSRDDPNSAAHAITMTMILPGPFLVALPDLTLHWSSKVTLTARFGQATPAPGLRVQNPDSLRRLREATHLLQNNIYPLNAKDRGCDFLVGFAPSADDGEIEKWLEVNSGCRPALEVYEELRNRQQQQEQHGGHHHQVHDLGTGPGFARTLGLTSAPFLVHDWIVDCDEAGNATVLIACQRIKSRHVFTGPRCLPDWDDDEGVQASQCKKQSIQQLKAFACTIDRLPASISMFGNFPVSILRHVEAAAVAHELSTTILHGVPLGSGGDLSHLITALTCGSVAWHTNYQRYEFLGDCVLKFIVSCQIFSQFDGWHEGMLTRRLESIVSNQVLTRAGLKLGLAPFINTRARKLRSWGPLMISEVEQEEEANNNRVIFIKVFADVVEALIGAVFIGCSDLGEADRLQAAKICANRFLPEIETAPLQYKVSVFAGGGLNLRPELQNQLEGLELIIGRRFGNRALLQEARTHPSMVLEDGGESYQRLEFLGDAILDMLVINALDMHRPNLTQGRMTIIKAALVNQHLLGFLCMDLAATRQGTPLIVANETSPSGGRTRSGWNDRKMSFRAEAQTERVHLWTYMLCDAAITPQRERAVRQFERSRDELMRQRDDGRRYPWVQLARLGAPKFLADMIEAILGAIFIDGGGGVEAMAECNAFMDRLGLWVWADKMIGIPEPGHQGGGRMDVWHPKAKMQRLGGGRPWRVIKMAHGTDTRLDTVIYQNSSPPKETNGQRKGGIEQPEQVVVQNGHQGEGKEKLVKTPETERKEQGVEAKEQREEEEEQEEEEDPGVQVKKREEAEKEQKAADEDQKERSCREDEGEENVIYGCKVEYDGEEIARVLGQDCLNSHEVITRAIEEATQELARRRVRG